MGIFIVNPSVWAMITPEAKERMMDEGDVVMAGQAIIQVWKKKRDPTPILGRVYRPTADDKKKTKRARRRG